MTYLIAFTRPPVIVSGMIGRFW